jgi:hypothetical protein
VNSSEDIQRHLSARQRKLADETQGNWQSLEPHFRALRLHIYETDTNAPTYVSRAKELGEHVRKGIFDIINENPQAIVELVALMGGELEFYRSLERRAQL